jgi:hypothetical protein
MKRDFQNNLLLHLWLVALTGLSMYYLYRAIDYRFLYADRLGPALFNKQFWYLGHVILALPVLLGAPLQFVPELRQLMPVIHRRLSGRNH